MFFSFYTFFIWYMLFVHHLLRIFAFTAFFSYTYILYMSCSTLPTLSNNFGRLVLNLEYLIPHSYFWSVRPSFTINIISHPLLLLTIILLDSTIFFQELLIHYCTSFFILRTYFLIWTHIKTTLSFKTITCPW